MSWRDFQEAAPELARLAQERFERAGVALIGTLRRDGSPRISPIEPVIAHGQLLLGMMWQSMKALDLRRDSRCVIHGVITNVAGTEGEVKLRGRAMEAQNSDQQKQLHQVFHERWGEHTPEHFHVFSMTIESATFIVYDSDKGEMIMKQWDRESGLREMRRPYP